MTFLDSEIKLSSSAAAKCCVGEAGEAKSQAQVNERDFQEQLKSISQEFEIDASDPWHAQVAYEVASRQLDNDDEIGSFQRGRLIKGFLAMQNAGVHRADLREETLDQDAQKQSLDAITPQDTRPQSEGLRAGTATSKSTNQ